MLFKDIIFEKVNDLAKYAVEYKVTVVLHDGQKVYCGNMVTHEKLHYEKENALQYLNEQMTYEIAQLIMDKVQKQIYSAVDSMMELSKATKEAHKSLVKMMGMGELDFKDDTYFVKEKSNFPTIKWNPDEEPLVTDEMAAGHELGLGSCECNDCKPNQTPPPESMNDLQKKYHNGKQDEWSNKFYDQAMKHHKTTKYHSGGLLGSPKKKSSYDYSSSSVVVELQKIFPNITQKVKHPVTGNTERLNNIIVNLNDVHKWDREDIADWIETLSLDLNAQEYDATMEMVSKTPAHVSHNTGSNEVTVQKGELSIKFKFDPGSYNEDIKDALAELNSLMVEKEKEKKNGTSKDN